MMHLLSYGAVGWSMSGIDLHCGCWWHDTKHEALVRMLTLKFGGVSSDNAWLGSGRTCSMTEAAQTLVRPLT